MSRNKSSWLWLYIFYQLLMFTVTSNGAVVRSDRLSGGTPLTPGATEWLPWARRFQGWKERRAFLCRFSLPCCLFHQCLSVSVLLWTCLFASINSVVNLTEAQTKCLKASPFCMMVELRKSAFLLTLNRAGFGSWKCLSLARADSTAQTCAGNKKVSGQHSTIVFNESDRKRRVFPT